MLRLGVSIIELGVRVRIRVVLRVKFRGCT